VNRVPVSKRIAGAAGLTIASLFVTACGSASGYTTNVVSIDPGGPPSLSPSGLPMAHTEVVTFTLKNTGTTASVPTCSASIVVNGQEIARGNVRAVRSVRAGATASGQVRMSFDGNGRVLPPTDATVLCL
jgi:hypothetical protein